MADFDVLVKLSSDVSGLISGLGQAASAVDGFSKSMSMKDVGQSLQSTGKMLTKGLTLPLLGLATGAAKVGIGFSDQMAVVGAVTGATAQEIQQLTDFADKMGRTTRYSAREAGQGMESLARAGFNVDQVTAALPHTLNLATAGAIGLGEAAGITANVLNSFGLEATQTQRVADVLAKTAAATDTNVSGLGETFKYVAPIASGLGLGLEEMAAAAGVMGNNGIKAGQAGNHLKRGLQNLTAPTKQQSDLMKDLGLEFFNANGQIKSMADIIAELETGFEGMTDQQKQAALATLFGAEASSGWNALLKEGSDELRSLQRELENSTGFAQGFADTVEDTLGGSLRNLKSALEGAAIGLFKAFEDPLRQVVDKITEVVNKFNELPASAKRSIGKVVFAMAAIGPALFIIGKLISFIANARVAFGLLKAPATAASVATKGAGMAAAASGVGFATLAMKLALIAGVVAIVVAALVILAQHAEGVKTVILALAEAIATIIVALGQGLAEIIRALGDAFAELARGIGDAIATVIEAATPLVEVIGTKFNELVQIVADAIVQIVQALAPFIPAITHMVEVVVSQIPTIIDSFANLVSSVGNSIDQVVTAIANGASQIITSLSGLVAQIGNSVSQILDAFGRLATRVAISISTVVRSVSSGVSKIIDSISNLVSEVSTGVSEVITAFGNMSTKVGDAISTINDSIATVIKSITGFVEQIGKTAKDLSESFGEVVGALKELSQIDLSGKGSELSSLAVGFGALALANPGSKAEDISKFAEAVGEVTGVDELATDVGSLGESISSLSDLATVATGLTSIGTAISGITGVEDLSTEFNSLGTEITSVGEVLETAGTAFTTFATTVTTAMTTLSTSVNEAFTGMAESIQTQVTTIQTQVTEAFTTMATNVQTQMTAMQTTITSAMTNIVSTITNGLNNIKSAVTSALNTIQQQVQTTTNTIRQTFTTTMTAIVSTVTSGFQRVVSAITSSMSQAVAAVRSAMSQAVAAMNSAAGQAAAAGANMGRGFYSGLSSMAGAIIGLARSIASQAAAAMRSALQIHSPSRVTKALGEFTGEGLAVGIEGTKRMVAKASERLADIAGSIRPGDIHIPNIQMGAVNGGMLTASMDEIVANRAQSMEVHLTMGGRTYNTFVEDITDVQNAKLRLSTY